MVKENLRWKNNWSKKLFLVNPIFNKLIHIKKVGDKIHPAEKHNLTHEEITLALEDVAKVCEWVIIAYLKRNGFNQNHGFPLC